MFFNSTQTRRRTIWITAAMLGAGALLLHAFNPQPDPPKTFGVFGITLADTIRLNVTNVGGELGQFAPPCRARIGFVNADGTLLKSADVSIADGHTASIALNFFEASNATSALARTRAMVRPTVEYAPPCFTAVSAEVADANTGRTNIYATPQVWASAPVLTNTPQ